MTNRFGTNRFFAVFKLEIQPNSSIIWLNFISDENVVIYSNSYLCTCFGFQSRFVVGFISEFLLTSFDFSYWNKFTSNNSSSMHCLYILHNTGKFTHKLIFEYMKTHNEFDQELVGEIKEIL